MPRRRLRWPSTSAATVGAAFTDTQYWTTEWPATSTIEWPVTSASGTSGWLSDWGTNTPVSWTVTNYNYNLPLPNLSSPLYEHLERIDQAFRQPTDDREARNREARNRAAAIERERAIERAELLLRESLRPAQIEELGMHNRITVPVTDKQGRPRIFELQRGRVANIRELNAQGHLVARWCVHPRLDVPDADTMLAQKLWLEHDCEELLRIANRHPV